MGLWDTWSVIRTPSYLFMGMAEHHRKRLPTFGIMRIHVFVGSTGEFIHPSGGATSQGSVLSDLSSSENETISRRNRVQRTRAGATYFRREAYCKPSVCSCREHSESGNAGESWKRTSTVDDEEKMGQNRWSAGQPTHCSTDTDTDEIGMMMILAWLYWCVVCSWLDCSRINSCHDFLV